jgi:cbb3-type cytochrome oxidase maturation protein
MSAFFIIIPMSMILAGIAIALLMWCFKTKQFDDMDRSSTQILHDDD